MFPEQVVYKVNTHEVYCDGESPAIGHPRVFLTMGEAKEISCPYCSKKFIYENK
ncbi:MAG: zinc-finger domain-containing protein [Alphaproteobacteria bacterium]|nr:zinc-finger domain-containing protein [Alphaproteobacteria bacterium]